jgi:hypothetical protein
VLAERPFKLDGMTFFGAGEPLDGEGLYSVAERAPRKAERAAPEPEAEAMEWPLIEEPLRVMW